MYLQTAHLDHDNSTADPALLCAMCQPCHLAYDTDQHIETRRAHRRDPVGLLLW